METKKYLTFRVSVYARVPLEEVDFYAPEGFNVNDYSPTEIEESINEGDIDFDWAEEVKRAELSNNVDVGVYEVEVIEE